MLDFRFGVCLNDIGLNPCCQTQEATQFTGVGLGSHVKCAMERDCNLDLMIFSKMKDHIETIVYVDIK